jgi:uncharacterized protein (TIGR03437 family)
MRFVLVALSLVNAALGSDCWNGPKPCYVAAGIVNSADFLASQLAPGSIATIFGTGLAYGTYSISQNDIAGGMLPVTLLGSGVHVLVNNLAAPVLYVSPKQINFIVPTILIPGPATVLVALDGNSGPAAPIVLQSGAPALFQLDAQTAIAQRLDGSLYTAESPAKPGDWITLYATGLGQIQPPVGYLEIPQRAASIADLSAFQVLIDGTPVSSTLIGYVGVTPGFGGLNQINLRLPAGISANPRIQLSLDGSVSPTGISIPAGP